MRRILFDWLWHIFILLIFSWGSKRNTFEHHFTLWFSLTTERNKFMKYRWEARTQARRYKNHSVDWIVEEEKEENHLIGNKRSNLTLKIHLASTMRKKLFINGTVVHERRYDIFIFFGWKSFTGFNIHENDMCGKTHFIRDLVEIRPSSSCVKCRLHYGNISEIDTNYGNNFCHFPLSESYRWDIYAVILSFVLRLICWIAISIDLDF